MQPIRLSWHAKEQTFFRGTIEEEINEAIQESPWQSAELGRQECRKNFASEKAWNNKHYKTK